MSKILEGYKQIGQKQMCRSKLIETNAKLKSLGDDFGGVKQGFVDYLFEGVNYGYYPT
ncbi:hypothetical protein KKE26_00985 [bacterium]|nr:hypothetical protein [bacterium]